MRILLVFGIFFCSSISWAESETSQVKADLSHFHLLTFHCEKDKQDGPESTPQSPPLDVDDPGTPGCNQWEINMVANGDLSLDQKSWELPLLDINYGIGDNLQLKYEVPYVTQQTSGIKTSAVGETRAGVKYMFYEDEESDFQLAAYPQVTIVSPDKTSLDKGIATNGTIVTLPFLFTKKIATTNLGNVNITANLGYSLSTKSSTCNYVSAAVGIAVPIHRRIAWMSEISSQQATGTLTSQDRQELVKFNMGLIGTITKSVYLFASAGHSIYTSDATGHAYVLSGLRLTTKDFQE